VKRIHIPRNSGESKVQQVSREARVMAQFDHPCIVRYYGTWIERPDPESQNDTHSLADWLKENQQTRDLTQMKSWFKQIVEAVAYIHDKGFIHRDLKPSNILFETSYRIRVCDLGIASELGPIDMTRTRTFDSGTQLYQSPEQMSCCYSYKVDVFTLGLIYAELCVPMTGAEQFRIFDNFRRGLGNELPIEDAGTVALVDRLTKERSADRPMCREVLEELSNTSYNF
ncbi:hypothetical protein PFISCL1PPCAC_984, partial [Pristionchus fissidentatus]